MPLMFLLLSLLDGFLQPHFTFLKLTVLFSWPLRNTTLLFWSLPAFQDSTGNRGHARVNSFSSSSTTSFTAAFAEVFRVWKCLREFYLLWLKMAVICSLFPGNAGRHRQLSSNILLSDLSLLGTESSH